MFFLILNIISLLRIVCLRVWVWYVCCFNGLMLHYLVSQLPTKSAFV